MYILVNSLSFILGYFHVLTLITHLSDDDTVYQRQACIEWASFSPMVMRRNCTILYAMVITIKMDSELRTFVCMKMKSDPFLAYSHLTP